MAGVCSGDGPCVTTPLGPSQKPWIAKVGGLPAYIRAIAHSLVRNGHDESSAIATAVATVKRWAAGGGNVSAETRARAAAAVAEWESKKAASHSLTAEPSNAVDLASSGGHHVPGTGYEWRHGYIPLTLEVAKANKKGAHLVPKGGHDKSKARVAIRPGSHEGQSGHHIVGTDAHGRRVRAFAPGDRSNAAKAAENIKAGRPAFDRNLVPAHQAPDLGPSITPIGASRAREMTGMTPAELRAKVAADKIRGKQVMAANAERGKREAAALKSSPLKSAYDRALADHTAGMGILQSINKAAQLHAAGDTAGARKELQESHDFYQRAEQPKVAAHAKRAHDALSTPLEGKDARSMTAAQKVEAFRRMHGHDPSPEQLRKLLGIKAAPRDSRTRASLAAAPSETADLAVPFDESKHPRKAGKFAPKGTQTQGAQPKPATTGQINPALAAQIRDFQKRMGLPVTGNFDQATVAKIQAVRTAKGGGGGGGKGKGGGKGGAAKASKAAAAAAKKQQAAAAKAAKQAAAKQKAAAALAARQGKSKAAATVSAVNALTPAQRAAYRARNPAPAGYAWTAKGTLAAVSTVAAQKQVAAKV